jgi:hypothetical protein
MKTSVVLSAILSFGILGLAGGFMAGKLGQDGGAAAGGSDLARIEERLAALEEGIKALGRLRSDIDVLKARTAEPQPVPAAQPDPSTATEEEKGTVAVAIGEQDGEPPTKLERWLDGQGMRGEFDDLVSQVYQKARTERLAREREEQAERAREMEALSQGPYGKYNYRVNSLSKKLGLDRRQEEYVHNLLLGLEERQRLAMEQIPRLEGEVTAEQLKEHRDHVVRAHQELSQQFESDLLAGLNAKQRETYESLPEHERISGDADTMKVISFGAAGGMVGTTGVRFSVPALKPMEVKLQATPPAPAPAK